MKIQLSLNFGGGGELPKYLTPAQRKFLAGYIAAGYRIKKIKKTEGIRSIYVEMSSTQTYRISRFDRMTIAHYQEMHLDQFAQIRYKWQHTTQPYTDSQFYAEFNLTPIHGDRLNHAHGR